MIADKSKPYKREYFQFDDERLKGCDATYGILQWCNDHENFIEIVEIIKTRCSTYTYRYNYDLVYREW